MICENIFLLIKKLNKREYLVIKTNGEFNRFPKVLNFRLRELMNFSIKIKMVKFESGTPCKTKIRHLQSGGSKRPLMKYSTKQLVIRWKMKLEHVIRHLLLLCKLLFGDRKTVRPSANVLLLLYLDL
jgi:hypothetical protein